MQTKLVVNGTLTYSFGKNGLGLSDEILKLGGLINELSVNNRVYLVDANIDAADDVYDLMFKIEPKPANQWLTEDKKPNTTWYSSLWELASKSIQEIKEETEETND